MEERKIKRDSCLGECVRMIRKRCGLKQAEFVSFFQGVQLIRASQLRAIKNALGTSYEELLEWSEP